MTLLHAHDGFELLLIFIIILCFTQWIYYIIQSKIALCNNNLLRLINSTKKTIYRWNKLYYFLAAFIVGVELILWTVDWLKTRPKPRIILPKNKFQKVWRTVGSGSKLKKKENIHVKNIVAWKYIRHNYKDEINNIYFFSY